MKRIFPILFLLALSPALRAQPTAAFRPRMSLSGVWRTPLGDCRLPGTTDENHLGEGCTDTTATHALTRLYPYEGQLDYERVVEIPAGLADRRLQLFIERSKPSTLWLDGDCIGHVGHLYAPHVYLLPPMAAGRHRLRLRIDNSPQAVPAEVHGSHAWSDATQTNWNGVLGDFYLEELPAAAIRSVQVYPDVARRRARVVLTLTAERAEKASIRVTGKAWNTPERRVLAPLARKAELAAGENRVELLVDMGENPLLWSEFHPALYRLTVELRTRHSSDCDTLSFGMRQFATEGTQFVLNGHKTFLRGKHDACVFPLTGYAPMDVAAWRVVFRTAKAYGINHYRCHSYAPPRAAFTAADIEGIYLQVELPLWGTIERKNERLNAFLKGEADDLLAMCGNHASFLMLGLGNELGGDGSLMREWLEEFRARDNRHLYCFGANNFLGWKGAQEGEDFFVTCRVGGGEGYSTHVRTSFAFVDADEGGLLNALRPSTVGDYSAAIASSPRPVVGHEVGQFQVYPDFTEIDRYTGVLRPYNLLSFRQQAAKNGLAGQTTAFHRASGKFVVECYKAEIEQALRTPGFGGFQLLDLQDYPGQGTALVGLLDAFMQSKGVVAPEEFRGWCSPVVPLARIADFCRWNDEPLHIEVELADYAEEDWTTPVAWRLATDDSTWVRSGTFPSAVAQGEVGRVGSIDLSLAELRQPCRLTLVLETGAHRNRYRLWVYPRYREPDDGVVVVRELDDAVRRQLNEGAAVLFVPRPEAVVRQTLGGLFTPDFWNYSMFKTISERAGKAVSPGTLSLLMDPSHPLWRDFPTDEHSDWQWWSAVRCGRPMVLDTLGEACRPLVQVVDNIERNHRLGLIFEFAVGRGRLLVCMSDLWAVADTPEGNQLRNALLKYLKNPEFRPSQSLGWQQLLALFGAELRERRIEGVENATDYRQSQH